jgi:hypothetical protein
MVLIDSGDSLGSHTRVDACGLSANVVEALRDHGCSTLGQALKKLEVLEADLSPSEAKELRQYLRPTD